MKKFRKTMALFLSVVMLVGICSAVPTYAQDISTNILIERNVQKSLAKSEKHSRRIAVAPMTTVSTYEELAAAVESKVTNIFLTQDIYLENTLQIDYDVFFLAAPQGKTIFADTGFRHIQITASDIQLQFDHVTLDGNYDGTGYSMCGGIYAENIANVSISGLTIQNCYGTAVFNVLQEIEDSSFSLYNCTVKNNKDGAIDSYAKNNLLYNVLCENNTDATINISLGADPGTDAIHTIIYNSIIRNNSASEGGGIQFYNTNAFLDANTIIENNYADSKGGGIDSYNSRIESYATIKNNTSLIQGGGVCLKDSTFVMQGGEISCNKANTRMSLWHYGGGIAIDNSVSNPNGDVIINDGLIEKNQAAFGGGIGASQIGAFDIEPSFVIINGGIIRNNGNQTSDTEMLDLCMYGGGIFAEKVEITDGIIEKNQASSAGGIATHYFIMSGGTIQDNGYFETEDGEIIVKTHSGGGVFCRKNAVISNGLIYGNMAEYGGGLYINGSLDLSAPAYIRYNAATVEGGGVYFYRLSGGSVGEIDYSRIKSNTAPKYPQYNGI